MFANKSDIRKDIGTGRRLRAKLARVLRQHRAERGASHVRTCYRTWGRHYIDRYGS